MSAITVLLVLVGLFTIAGGVLNWDWFMNSYRARFFVKFLGRDRARVFYVLLGFAIIYLAFRAG